MNMIEMESEFFNDVRFSNETHLLLLGHVDSKNNGFWGIQTPSEVPQKFWHSGRCTASVAMSKRGEIEPFWFGDADGEAVTVMEECKVVVINKI